MRKIIAIEWLSLDGFMAGPNGEIDWFVWNEEIEKYSKEVMSTSDLMLFGRTTFETMVAYWPTPASDTEDKAITDFMNNTPKIVFSKTLKKIEWKNSKLVKDIVPDEILKMKQKPGKDILIYGSGSIVSQFTKQNLIDKYMIFMNPIVLDRGKPLFQETDKFKLELVGTKTFKGGNTLLQYIKQNS